MVSVPNPAPLLARLSENHKQRKVKQVFLAKKPSSPQDDSHLEISFITLEANVKLYVSTLTDAQLIQQYRHYVTDLTNSPKVPNKYYIPALKVKWLTCSTLAPNNANVASSSTTNYTFHNIDAYYDAGGIDYDYEF